ncbi:hypothetical protein G5I_04755 [Acromyrmex echinatior]|uniref:Uncharacterized protein n=1 Tax=Acromyrmex echinatior TaxID=103372 RepID=F4WGH6_ACREC|nr:hypothetical protein G5I_04755 [Acromyrmex echinatior]
MPRNNCDCGKILLDFFPRRKPRPKAINASISPSSFFESKMIDIEKYKCYVLQTSTTILFFGSTSTMVGVEIRAEPSDNGLTELKRGTGQAPQKFVNANQPEGITTLMQD